MLIVEYNGERNAQIIQTINSIEVEIDSIAAQSVAEYDMASAATRDDYMDARNRLVGEIMSRTLPLRLQIAKLQLLLEPTYIYRRT